MDVETILKNDDHPEIYILEESAISLYKYNCSNSKITKINKIPLLEFGSFEDLKICYGEIFMTKMTETNDKQEEDSAKQLNKDTNYLVTYNKKKKKMLFFDTKNNLAKYPHNEQSEPITVKFKDLFKNIPKDSTIVDEAKHGDFSYFEIGQFEFLSGSRILVIDKGQLGCCVLKMENIKTITIIQHLPNMRNFIFTGISAFNFHKDPVDDDASYFIICSKPIPRNSSDSCETTNESDYAISISGGHKHQTVEDKEKCLQILRVPCSENDPCLFEGKSLNLYDYNNEIGEDNDENGYRMRFFKNKVLSKKMKIVRVYGHDDQLILCDNRNRKPRVLVFDFKN